ncbi:PQQ-binding-like beta-propeller repeat protein [Spongiimicrobium sp. 2-473A-2-J]|uniref:outer membrane protein assembly factor BamB family protein n=1 Tax=Eudoraea algarum TaxID=3417568 RepID=UPI003D368535
MESRSKIGWILGLVLLTMPIGHAQKELWMSSSDANITKRAQRQPAPKFQIPTGASHVDNMQLIGPDRLLVGLREDAQGVPNADYLLIDTRKGTVLWRYPREKGAYHIQLIFDDLLLIRVDGEKKTDFLALDPTNGTEKWRRSFKSKNTSFLPVLPSGQIWAFQDTSKKVQITGFTIADGETVWQSESAGTMENSPSPVVHDPYVFTTFDGLKALDPRKGTVLYNLPELQLHALSPPLEFDDSHLYVITKNNDLAMVDKASGTILSRTPLSDNITFTNVYHQDGVLYLRGLDDQASHYLIAFSVTDKKELWRYTIGEPLLSNLVLHKGKLFMGTASSLLALNSSNGNQMLAVKVTDTGRNYPVTLREVAGNIVYVGELVIAAYDATTGIQTYKHGMSPLGPDLHLNGLDASIPNLKEELGKLKASASPGLGAMANAETRSYQQMANRHYSDYLSYKNSGNYSSSQHSYTRYKISNEMAKTQATVAMAISLAELGGAIAKGMQAAAVKASIEKQELFRKSILDVYSRSQSAAYLYRPHMAYHSSNDQFATLSLIHLPSGKIRRTYLSPIYQSYGLWNLVDFENQTVYHHGIGMNPALYTLSKARKSTLFSKIKTVETFIIAVPLRLQE